MQNTLLTNEQVAKIDFSKNFIKFTIDLSAEFKDEYVTSDDIITFCNNYLRDKDNNTANPIIKILNSVHSIFSSIEKTDRVNTKLELLFSGECDCYIITRGSSQCWINAKGEKECICCETCCLSHG